MTDDLPTDDFAGVVYDLDGTLVRLAVDWEAVRRDVAAVFESAGVDPGGATLWDLLEDAASVGLHDEVEATIAEHERTGARQSERLPLADCLASVAGPVGVCSLNCESACRVALGTHDLADDVDVVVGRDTVGTWKPDPEPLLAALEAVGVDPAAALFVGDSPRDEETAERAGTAFRYVEDVV